MIEDWLKYSEGCTGHKSYEYAAKKKKKIGKGAFFSFLFVFLFFIYFLLSFLYTFKVLIIYDFCVVT